MVGIIYVTIQLFSLFPALEKNKFFFLLQKLFSILPGIWVIRWYSSILRINSRSLQRRDEMIQQHSTKNHTEVIYYSRNSWNVQLRLWTYLFYVYFFYNANVSWFRSLHSSSKTYHRLMIGMPILVENKVFDTKFIAFAACFDTTGRSKFVTFATPALQ